MVAKKQSEQKLPEIVYLLKNTLCEKILPDLQKKGPNLKGAMTAKSSVLYREFFTLLPTILYPTSTNLFNSSNSTTPNGAVLEQRRQQKKRLMAKKHTLSYPRSSASLTPRDQ